MPTPCDSWLDISRSRGDVIFVHQTNYMLRAYVPSLPLSTQMNNKSDEHVFRCQTSDPIDCPISTPKAGTERSLRAMPSSQLKHKICRGSDVECRTTWIPVRSLCCFAVAACGMCGTCVHMYVCSLTVASLFSCVFYPYSSHPPSLPPFILPFAAAIALSPLGHIR